MPQTNDPIADHLASPEVDAEALQNYFHKHPEKLPAFKLAISRVFRSNEEATRAFNYSLITGGEPHRLIGIEPRDLLAIIRSEETTDRGATVAAAHFYAKAGDAMNKASPGAFRRMVKTLPNELTYCATMIRGFWDIDGLDSDPDHGRTVLKLLMTPEETEILEILLTIESEYPL